MPTLGRFQVRYYIFNMAGKMYEIDKKLYYLY